MIDNVPDFARDRLGGGIALNRLPEPLSLGNILGRGSTG